MMQLEPLLNRKPSRLSGGEQQRVALGRAIVRHPQAFLMDEPLTNLDAELRADMRAEIKHLQRGWARRWSTSPTTRSRRCRSVTGSRSSTRAASSRSGRRWRSTSRPARLFAARFIGSPPMNLIEAEVTNGHLTAAGGLALTAPRRPAARRARGRRRPPRALRRVRPGRRSRAARGRVVSREALGDEMIYVVETEAGLLNVRMPPTVRFAEDAAGGLRYQGTAPPVYDPESGQVVGRWAPRSSRPGSAKSFGDVQALDGTRPRRAGGRVLRGARAVRGGQDDDAARDRRPREARLRDRPPDRDRRDRGHARPSATWPWCSRPTRSTRSRRPHDNIASPLRARRLRKAEVDARVEQVARACCTSSTCSSASPRSCRAASSSAWRSGGRSCASRGRSSWTSRSPTSTSSCGSRCAPS